MEFSIDYIHINKGVIFRILDDMFRVGRIEGFPVI